MAGGSNQTQRDLDDALEATFPASDPPAVTTHPIATVSPGGKDAVHVEAEAVEVFRVVHRTDANAPFSSSGNRSGGRWTSPGVPAVYASLSPAGAMLEFLAHMNGEKPADLVLVRARMPSRAITAGTSLPAQWRETPHREDVRAYGNAWIDSRRSLALNLPSVLCEQSRNLLINPEHPDVELLAIDSVEAFTLDPRLMRGDENRGSAPASRSADAATTG